MTARKKFINHTAPIEFDIDDDTFFADPNVPGGVLLSIVDRVNDEKGSMKQIEILVDFLNQALMPDSAALFQSRLNDPANPIALATALDVTHWLVQELTARPTELPSGSPDGQLPTGMSSTD